MQAIPKVQTEALTPHEREVAALVLREYADEMDKNGTPCPMGADWIPVSRVLTSRTTVEMREIAWKLEWGG